MCSNCFTDTNTFLEIPISVGDWRRFIDFYLKNLEFLWLVFSTVIILDSAHFQKKKPLKQG